LLAVSKTNSESTGIAPTDRVAVIVTATSHEPESRCTRTNSESTGIAPTDRVAVIVVAEVVSKTKTESTAILVATDGVEVIVTYRDTSCETAVV